MSDRRLLPLGFVTVTRSGTEARVMDPLQLFVANDCLSVRLSLSDCAKKTFITEVSPPSVPVITVPVAPPFFILFLILCIKKLLFFWN